MEKTIDISFSDQAETILNASGIDKNDVIDFLVEQGGFTVGGNEVIGYLEYLEQED